MKIKIPKPPKIFFCEECRVFFFSFSKMVKPTHPKCFGHKTRLATNKEVDKINKTNNLSFQYNQIEVKE